jgi:hypothetical protein
MFASAMVLGVLLVNLLATACGLPPVETARVTQELLQGSTGLPAETVPHTPLPPRSAVLAAEGPAASTEVPKWKRYEITLSNASWQGNPFDIELTGEFKNAFSGRILTQLGFYAGDNTWKIYFMPDELGEWSYVTRSPDTDLDGNEGSFTCVASDLPGKLIGQGNRWILQDSKQSAAPIMLPTREWFKRTNTKDGVDGFIRWADKTAGALLIGTTLVYFTQGQDEIPYLKGQEGQQFNIPMWDRLNSHYDLLRDQGMGFYIMFYSDDQESPNQYGIEEKSKEELRLFRYAIARFSAYPIVMWDTGIDIQETRSNEWIDWFADWFEANDPWQHPVSSRTGGGSGGKFPANGTYYSDGTSTLPAHSAVVSRWKALDVPLAFTDRWRENYSRGGFDRDKIRRAAWEVGLVGGSAVYVGGNAHEGYLGQDYVQDFEAAPDLGIRSKFFNLRIKDFANLAPHDELLSADQAVLSASIGKEYLVYDANGGQIEVNLSGASETLSAQWFNPRTGGVIRLEPVSGGGTARFTTPDSKDWVLHLGLGDLGGPFCVSPFNIAGSVSPAAEVLSINENQLDFRIFVPMIGLCS